LKKLREEEIEKIYKNKEKNILGKEKIDKADRKEEKTVIEEDIRV
jgi:hypothetical protein